MFFTSWNFSAALCGWNRAASMRLPYPCRVWLNVIHLKKRKCLLYFACTSSYGKINNEHFFVPKTVQIKYICLNLIYVSNPNEFNFGSEHNIFFNRFRIVVDYGIFFSMQLFCELFAHLPLSHRSRRTTEKWRKLFSWGEPYEATTAGWPRSPPTPSIPTWSSPHPGMTNKLGLESLKKSTSLQSSTLAFQHF